MTNVMTLVLVMFKVIFHRPANHSPGSLFPGCSFIYFADNEGLCRDTKDGANRCSGYLFERVKSAVEIIQLIMKKKDGLLLLMAMTRWLAVLFDAEFPDRQVVFRESVR